MEEIQPDVTNSLRLFGKLIKAMEIMGKRYYHKLLLHENVHVAN